MLNIKKRFFKRELKRTKAEIWADEFAIFATRKERESVREQHSQAQDVQYKIEEQMKANPKDQELAKQGQLVQKRAEELEKIMVDLDQLLDGKEAEEPGLERMGGLTERLEGKIRKGQRIREFIKNNC